MQSSHYTIAIITLYKCNRRISKKKTKKSPNLFGLCASGWCLFRLCRLSEAKNHDPGQLVKAHKKAQRLLGSALQDGLEPTTP